MLDLIPIFRVPVVPLSPCSFRASFLSFEADPRTHLSIFSLRFNREDFSKVRWSPDLSGFQREPDPSCPPCLPHQNGDTGTERAAKQDEKTSLSTALNLLGLVLNPTR